MKNKILMTITYFMVAMLFVAGCGLDSDNLLPFVLCGISLAWLALFSEVNKEVIIWNYTHIKQRR